MTVNQRKWISLGFWLFAIFCCALSIRYAVNIPMLDDYKLVLDFLVKLRESSSFGEKVSLLFTPVNNHLIVTYYLTILADYAIFKEINFRHLIIGINLGYLATLYVIYRLFRLSGIQPLSFIPVILLFSIPIYNLLNWSSSGMHVYPVLFTVLTILAFAQGNRYHFLQACVWATLAAMSSGGGVLAFFCGIPFLLNRTSRGNLLIWAIIFSLLLVPYYLNFGTMGHTFSLGQIPIYGVNFLVFFGTIFKSFYGHHHHWGIIFGLLVLISLSWIIIAHGKFLRQNPILLSGLALSLLLAILITLTRSQLGLGATTSYRYQLYHILPLIFLYLFFLKHHGLEMMPVTLLAIVGVSLILYGFRLEDAWSVLKKQSRQLQMGMEIYRLAGSPHQLSFSSTEKAGEILSVSVQSGTYQIPSKPSLVAEIEPKQTKPKQSMQYKLSEFTEESAFVLISGWAYPSFFPSTNLEILFIVESRKQKFYFRTSPYLSDHVLMGKSDISFLVVLDKSSYPMDWSQVNYGLALCDPIRGIIAETYLDVP